MSTSLAQTPLQQRLQIAPSIRQQNVVRATEEYAAAHVEPLLNELVTFLCLQKPRKKDLGKFIVEYLRMKKEGKELAPDPDPKSAFKRTDIDAAIRGLMHEVRSTCPVGGHVRSGSLHHESNQPPHRHTCCCISTTR